MEEHAEGRRMVYISQAESVARDIQSEIQGGREMSEFEQLRRNTEKAYQAALNALFDLVNAITEERNYYRELCNQKENEQCQHQE